VDKKGKIRREENHRNQEQMMGGGGTPYSCKAARGLPDCIGVQKPESGTAPDPSLLFKKRSEVALLSRLVDCTMDTVAGRRESTLNGRL
jgi:hypothetical protein